jgi:hypothetical protein
MMSYNNPPPTHPSASPSPSNSSMRTLRRAGSGVNVNTLLGMQPRVHSESGWEIWSDQNDDIAFCAKSCLVWAPPPLPNKLSSPPHKLISLLRKKLSKIESYSFRVLDLVSHTPRSAQIEAGSGSHDRPPHAGLYWSGAALIGSGRRRGISTGAGRLPFPGDQGDSRTATLYNNRMHLVIRGLKLYFKLSDALVRELLGFSRCVMLTLIHVVFLSVLLIFKMPRILLYLLYWFLSDNFVYRGKGGWYKIKF